MRYLVLTLIVSLLLSCSGAERDLSRYWEGHDFSSLDYFDNIELAEDGFEGYVKLLSEVPYDVAEASMTEFLDSAAANPVAYGIWAEWFKSCLHALGSPYRNDELFSVFLKKATADKVLGYHTLETLIEMKNVFENGLPGAPAPDVVLRDTAGSEIRFSDFAGKRVLLQLLDANCPSCTETINLADAEYRGEEIEKIALFVHCSPSQLEKITDGLPASWHYLWCPGREIEKGTIFDLSLLPSKLIIGEDGLIDKTYHL